MNVSVLWLLLMVQWVGLHCVIVAFPDFTHLLFVTECWLKVGLVSLLIILYYMGLVATKPVFWVSNTVRFKPVCSATGTNLKIEISLVASFDMVLLKCE